MEDPATIDYPASIDYILNITQQKDLYFIGYSMGTSHYFMLLSEKPQYNEKIKAGIMIGPAIYLDNPIFKHFRHILTTILNVIEWLGQYEAASSALAELSHRACTNQFFSPLCHRMWNKLLNANDDLKTSLVKMSNTPAGSAILKLKFLYLFSKKLLLFILLFFTGSSIKTYKHYMQHMSGKFSKYDYGTKANLKKYGTTYPPKYNLENVRVPTKLYVAQSDEFSSVLKNADLVSDLPNSLGYHIVDRKDWNHMDFAFSSELNERVHNHILTDLSQFEEEGF